MEQPFPGIQLLLYGTLIGTFALGLLALGRRR